MKTTTLSVFFCKRFFLLLLIFFTMTSAWGSGGGGTQASKEKKESALPPKLDHLCQEFEKALKIDNDPAAFDSLATSAIHFAESSFQQENILLTYLRVLKVIDKGDYRKINFKDLIEKTEELAFKQDPYAGFSTWLTLSNSASRMEYANMAKKYALKAFSDASAEKSAIKKVKAFLALGKSNQLEKDYLSSYQNFLHANNEVEMIHDHHEYTELKKACFKHLFHLFDDLSDFEEAASYNQKQIQLILEEKPLDSLELMWAKLDFIGIAIRDKKYAGLKEKFEEILHYADQIHHQKLHDYSLTYYRTLLIDSKDSEGFNYLYQIKYPDELEKLKSTDPIFFYKINAHISEYQGDFDQALAYYKLAEALIEKKKDHYIKSNFFRRYGQFLLLNKMDDDALAAFYRSFEEAKIISYEDYMREASFYIDSLSYVKGNMSEAYKYAKINNDLVNKKSEMAKDDEFNRMKIRNEKKRIEFLQAQEEMAQKKQFDLQYWFIGALISFLLMIFVIASQMKVSLWVVKGTGFIGVLMVFEFIILILDHKIHHMTHGAPLWIFIIKVLILFVLFPLHHLVEKAVIKYMLEKKLVLKPQKGSLKKVLHAIWPWMKE